MSPAPQAEECQQRVDGQIALDSTFLLRKVLLRKVVHKAQVLSSPSSSIHSRFSHPPGMRSAGFAPAHAHQISKKERARQHLATGAGICPCICN